MTIAQFLDALDTEIREWTTGPLAITRSRTANSGEWRRNARWCRVRAAGEGVESSMGLDGSLSGHPPLAWPLDHEAAQLVAQSFGAFLSTLSDD